MKRDIKKHKEVALEMKRALRQTSNRRVLAQFINSQDPTRLTHRREHLWLGRAMEGAPI